ncbi:MAG TPA: TlpA disulfide reductase family protein [Fontimonas sp.]
MLLAGALSLPAAAALPEGALAPDFLGPSRTGKPVKLSDFAGKPVIVSFWASWCAPCLEEMPLLEALQRKLGRERIEVVAVNWGEDSERYRQLLTQLTDVQMTLTHDAAKLIGQTYGLDDIPQLYLIDREGRIAYQRRGYSADSAQQLLDAVNRLLAD